MTQSEPRTKQELVDAGIPLTYDSWTDPCGQTYEPGDYVAVAVINGRSPQMVIGKVISINRVNSKRMEIGDFSYHYDDRLNETYVKMINDGGYDQSELDAARKALRDSRYSVFTPSCTVTVDPVIDGRNFYRSGMKLGAKVKRVTYQFPGNIVKVEIDPKIYEPTIEALKEIHQSL